MAVSQTLKAIAYKSAMTDSAVASAAYTIDVPAAPAAPTGLVATANSATQITLDSTDNSADETGFKIERSPDGSTDWTQIATAAANATSYADTGRSAVTTYFYRVRANNAVGDSAFTNTASATTFTLTLPTAAAPVSPLRPAPTPRRKM